MPFPACRTSRDVINIGIRCSCPPTGDSSEKDCDFLARRLPGPAQRVGPTPVERGHRTTQTRPAQARPQPTSIPGFLTRPDEAIDKLGPIDDPLIGVFVHWVYGPHTCDGVVGKDNPLLLASNFSGTWPGLVALLNTGACLESLNRRFSPHLDRRRRLDQGRRASWSASTSGARPGQIRYPEDELHYSAAVTPEAERLAAEVVAEIRRAARPGPDARRHLDGHDQRLLRPAPAGPARLRRAQGRSGVAARPHEDGEAASASRRRFASCSDKGVTFHWREKDAADFTEDATRTQLRMYLAVLDLLAEFKADCLGWQYQLGLLPVLPPSDFCEGLLNSTAGRSRTATLVITSTEADQGNLDPDGADEAAAQGEGPAPGGDVPRRALGRHARGPLAVGAAQLRLLRRLRLQPRPGHAARRAQLPPAGGLFPDPRRHVRRREPARAR